MPAIIRIAAILIAFTGFASHAHAQSYDPYGYGSYGYGFDWDGFYSGVYGGGVPFGDETSWNGGIFAGVNVDFGGPVVGVEAQLGIDIADELGLDALILGRGGYGFGDVLGYAAVGTGYVGGDFGYAVGGGLEYGFTDYLSARGEVLGTGAFGDWPSDVRITAGLAFHL